MQYRKNYRGMLEECNQKLHATQINFFEIHIILEKELICIFLVLDYSSKLLHKQTYKKKAVQEGIYIYYLKSCNLLYLIKVYCTEISCTCRIFIS